MFCLFGGIKRVNVFGLKGETMSNVIDCMQCKYLSSLDITVDNAKTDNNRIEIIRDCAKDIKETPYIIIELSPDIKQEINCKEFELGNKTMMNELNKNAKKKRITAFLQSKFTQFLPISKYDNDEVILKENEIGMMYNCSVIFNPEYRD